MQSDSVKSDGTISDLRIRHSQSSCWAWMLGYKKDHVKRLSSRPQLRLAWMSSRPSEVHSARLFAALDATAVEVGLNFLGPTT